MSWTFTQLPTGNYGMGSIVHLALNLWPAIKRTFSNRTKYHQLIPGSSLMLTWSLVRCYTAHNWTRSFLRGHSIWPGDLCVIESALFTKFQVALSVTLLWKRGQLTCADQLGEACCHSCLARQCTGQCWLRVESIAFLLTSIAWHLLSAPWKLILCLLPWGDSSYSSQHVWCDTFGQFNRSNFDLGHFHTIDSLVLLCMPHPQYEIWCHLSLIFVCLLSGQSADRKD